MKILVISQGSIPIPPILYGGSERVLYNLCSSLVNNKYSELIEAVRDINCLSNQDCRRDACKRFSITKYKKETEKIYSRV